ncbi:hypothetical protein M5W83_04505 [Paenibacillus thiaminolyticus]|uniref:Uncharacterized protein n=1 Tax=Paenibacillus thiaminolyticus TaxID=49283 RepID=A0ABT4FSD2_PANTH|nr:hypothetical protein [Paenibacillus thiaminolyticus]MCY9538864.1 hypothetical protein [Paenibacillus thiaminolyticus]MCY9600461.1 hypothetical protein [Paenibacillus thiaminolyticus]MCY9606420.1 hypothetical protein [Paenibacillus thiaminolyticus]MCY9611908.1 hypothetical protein [Paenibacillus thiaminolyticus]MCY9621949.1 hypothetical protein [Paenibacillus thiaminolyticus]
MSLLFPAHEAVGTKLIIGKFCSIAAEAVVVRDVEPYPIAGGDPAWGIRRRFSPETIPELLEIRRWDCGSVDGLFRRCPSFRELVRHFMSYRLFYNGGASPIKTGSMK